MQVKTKTTKKAFTIVELLTVMSIIIILISLLVPALRRVQQFARQVRQNAQFHSIAVGLDLFHNDTGDYPPSNWGDNADDSYCGAMKLAEAMVGQDLLGFHPDSVFRRDRTNGNPGEYLYINSNVPYPYNALYPSYAQNTMARKKQYVDLDQANATKMSAIYSDFGDFTNDANDIYVLTDVFEQRMPDGDGDRHGMPILYYKANTAGNINPNQENDYPYDANSATDGRRIYLYEDNDELIQLGVPFDSALDIHPMDSTNTATGMGPLENFYWQINNDNIELFDGRPYKADTYILLSAGEDGLYGTRDDIYNFQKK
ncbi:MAG: hypothetical protein WC374_08045 [Phycisphaerae bacterium]|jgi:type II secretory pathway pseudopilin PulG